MWSADCGEWKCHGVTFQKVPGAGIETFSIGAPS
jgi:hypothetical protein